MTKVLRKIVGLLLIFVSIAAVIAVFNSNTTHTVTVTTTITTIYVLTGYRAGWGLVFSTLGLVIFAAGVTIGLMLLMPETVWIKHHRAQESPRRGTGDDDPPSARN